MEMKLKRMIYGCRQCGSEFVPVKVSHSLDGDTMRIDIGDTHTCPATAYGAWIAKIAWDATARAHWHCPGAVYWHDLDDDNREGFTELVTAMMCQPHWAPVDWHNHNLEYLREAGYEWDAFADAAAKVSPLAAPWDALSEEYRNFWRIIRAVALTLHNNPRP